MVVAGQHRAASAGIWPEGHDLALHQEAAVLDLPGDGRLGNQHGSGAVRGGNEGQLLGEILGKTLAMSAQRIYNATERVIRLYHLVIWQLATSSQCEPYANNWQTRQVEGLVALTGSAGSSPVSGTLKGKDLRQAGVLALLLPGPGFPP